jgi:hypothetical protein
MLQHGCLQARQRHMQQHSCHQPLRAVASTERCNEGLKRLDVAAQQLECCLGIDAH